MITTRYGNQYTEQEWAEMMANWDREIAQTHDRMDQEEAIIKQGAKMLKELAGDKAYTIAYHLYHADREIRFSSEEKRITVESISKWMDSEASRLGL